MCIRDRSNPVDSLNIVFVMPVMRANKQNTMEKRQKSCGTASGGSFCSFWQYFLREDPDPVRRRALSSSGTATNLSLIHI